MQGCGYRDRHAQFEALGVRIVAAGFAPPEEAAAWAEEAGFPFELWTDSGRDLASWSGAAGPDDEKPVRLSMLLDAHARVLLVYEATVNGAAPDRVLADAQRLAAEGKLAPGWAEETP